MSLNFLFLVYRYSLEAILGGGLRFFTYQN